jgi:hypothetical protein
MPQPNHPAGDNPPAPFATSGQVASRAPSSPAFTPFISAIRTRCDKGSFAHSIVLYTVRVQLSEKSAWPLDESPRKNNPRHPPDHLYLNLSIQRKKG